MLKSFLLIFFTLTAFTQKSDAKSFSNSYIRFEMPNKWVCKLRKKAYLCRHRIPKTCKANSKGKGCAELIKKSREAVIVISAKPKSKVDSLQDFARHFGEAKKIKASNFATSQSKVIHNKKVNIKKLSWVDGMHLGSEIPYYYTRYLATINGNVAVLVSFTSHKKFYTNYSSEFFKGIKSLEVTASQLSAVNKNELGNKLLSRPIDIPDEFFADIPDQQHQEDGLSTILFGLAMLLAGIGIYIWLKRKK